MTRAAIASIGLAALILSACVDMARLTVADGTGPNPRWVKPHQTLVPTVNIAPARGWPSGVTPKAASGTRVAAFARGLDHPRWLMVLPNGDVLVAETNAPARPDDGQGMRGVIMGSVMRRAGAAAPSANRITLLRDSRGTGVADTRSVLLEGLNAPFGMALVGTDFVSSSIRWFDYRVAAGRISDRTKAPPMRLPYSQGCCRLSVRCITLARTVLSKTAMSSGSLRCSSNAAV